MQVGLTCGQAWEQWAHDVATAKEASIDGFALNIGPSDPWTEEQLDMAYRVAEQAGDFVLFISFEYVNRCPTCDSGKARRLI